MNREEAIVEIAKKLYLLRTNLTQDNAIKAWEKPSITYYDDWRNSFYENAKELLELPFLALVDREALFETSDKELGRAIYKAGWIKELKE